MDLRPWKSNADRVMEEKITAVLGYHWDKRNDELYCELPKEWNNEHAPIITKKSVLSMASRIFDHSDLLHLLCFS